MVKAVYCFDASSIAIHQEPAFKSKQEKYPCTNLALNGFLYPWEQIGVFLGSGIQLQKSMQKHRPLSFLHSNTTALHHGLWLGHIVPTSNISFTCAWTSSTIGGRILWNLSLKGSSSMILISCFTRSVQPNSPGSMEKMAWYSASRTQAAAWCLSDLPSR